MGRNRDGRAVPNHRLSRNVDLGDLALEVDHLALDRLRIGVGAEARFRRRGGIRSSTDQLAGRESQRRYNQNRQDTRQHIRRVHPQCWSRHAYPPQTPASFTRCGRRYHSERRLYTRQPPRQVHGKTAPRELRNPRPVRSLVAARRLPPIVSLLEVTIPRLACETSPGSLRRLVWVCDGAQSAAAADRSRTLTGQPPTGAAPLDPDESDSARGFLLGRWCRARAHVLTSAACLPPRSTKRTATLRPPAVWVKASDPGGVSGGWPTSPGRARRVAEAAWHSSATAR